MDHQPLPNSAQIKDDGDGDDDSPEEFQCFVCLDIMYKPVVLACGHISCFWCVFKAMDGMQVSHCPVCRMPYHHFPRICELMHFLFKTLYPSAYKSKEKQVAEEEKEYGHTSPQFHEELISAVLNTGHSSSPLMEDVPNKSNSICGGDHSFIQDSSKRTFHDINNIRNTLTASGSHQEVNCVSGEHDKEDLLTHLQCAVCKQLLFRPVVLNCGHVYCQACISPQYNVRKCPNCESEHPSGFPNVCLVLENFLEKHFPDEYSARRQSLLNFQNANPSRGICEQAAQAPSVPKYTISPLFSGPWPKSHPGVGCDYCGMWPIIGERYRCKDCVEKIGFDLCKKCYSSSSKLPGRFNQQHTQDHQFEIVQPDSENIILSLAAEHSEGIEVHIDGANTVFLMTSYSSSNASEGDELEILSSANTSDYASGDLEDAGASPTAPQDHSQDQSGNSAA